MSNSSLISYTKHSPNHSGKRTHTVDRITPHCVVGQLSAEQIANCFPKGREASCNYGIGKDGRIALIVDEANRSWCSSSAANDQRAITIECASDTKNPYKMTDAVYSSLIKLCTDICRRYKKTKLIWFGDKTKTLAYTPKSNEMVLTVHRWFANKACPGDWLYSRLDDVAKQVTANLSSAAKPKKEKTNATKTKTTKDTSQKVKVIVDALNIRKSATTDSAVVGVIRDRGTYTITETKDNWGRLKSGAGWISLDYCTKV